MKNKQFRLLFVDDEYSIRMLIKNQFIHEGFFVDTADDGDTAVENLKTNSYDVIVLDIKMPRMNGIEVLKYIKQHGIQSRVIILTAVDDLAFAIEAVKNGADDYLTKPIDLDGLLARIQKVMAK